MSDRVLWFLLGAGALYLLAGKSGAGVGGGFSVSVGGNVGASTPPDQRWPRPTAATTEVEGVWDPMGAPTWYKLAATGSDGNKVFSGGGLN